MVLFKAYEDKKLIIRLWTSKARVNLRKNVYIPISRNLHASCPLLQWLGLEYHQPWHYRTNEKQHHYTENTECYSSQKLCKNISDWFDILYIRLKDGNSHLWPITNRIIIPFSSSNFRLFSTTSSIIDIKPSKHILILAILKRMKPESGIRTLRHPSCSNRISSLSATKSSVNPYNHQISPFPR